MGSDFITMRIAIAKGKKPDFKKGGKHIDKLRNTPYAKWPKQYLERFYEVDHSPDDISNSADLAAILMGDLDELHRNWIDGGRECDIFVVGNKKVFITGGFSCGDDPCDLWGSLDRLISAGVTKACGFDW